MSRDTKILLGWWFAIITIILSNPPNPLYLIPFTFSFGFVIWAILGPSGGPEQILLKEIHELKEKLLATNHPIDETKESE